MPLKHVQWATLRKIVRDRSVRGYDLRLNMSRGTKDGRLLVELEKLGLIVASGTDEGVLEKMYTLTAAGVTAAEYGECEVTTDILREIYSK